MAKGKYSNLRSKTIFDFTKDKEVIEEIIVVDKDTYFNELAENPVINALHLIEFAEMTKNNDLKAAVKTQYREELAALNNEA